MGRAKSRWIVRSGLNWFQDGPIRTLQGDRVSGAPPKNHVHEFNYSQILDRGRFGRTRAARTRRRIYAGQPRQGRAAQTRQARRSGDLLFAGAYARRPGQASVLYRYRHGENGGTLSIRMGGGFKPYRRDVAWAKAE